jgi:hypothetical protein
MKLHKNPPRGNRVVLRVRTGRWTERHRFSLFSFNLLLQNRKIILLLLRPVQSLKNAFCEQNIEFWTLNLAAHGVNIRPQFTDFDVHGNYHSCAGHHCNIHSTCTDFSIQKYRGRTHDLTVPKLLALY